MLSSTVRLAGLRRIRFVRYQSTSAVTKDTNDKKDIVETNNLDWDKIKTVYSRQLKKPARPPLMKNLFGGKFDSELIAFPEVINRDDMADLYKSVDQSKEFFRTIDSKEINKSGMIPSEVIEGLRNLDAFGTDVPRKLGGQEYFASESCLRGESEAEDINVLRTLNVHRLVTQILSECGSEAQKSKFLPLLAKGTYTIKNGQFAHRLLFRIHFTGDIVGTVGIMESEIASKGIFNTTAVRSLRGGDWTLNGKKSFVINGKNADLILILAGTKILDKLGDKIDAVTAFLIETDMNGVEVKESPDTIGCNGIQQCEVNFNGVEIGEGT